MKKFYETRKFLNNLVVLSFITVFSVSTAAFAQNEKATLSGIEINPSANNSYQIVLKSDRKVPFKKFVTADDKIVLELNGIQAASNVDTVYNNASNIDHVIVHPSGNDSVRIFLQGSNVASSKVAFESQPGSLGFLSEPATDASGQNVVPSETGVENSVNNADSSQAQVLGTDTAVNTQEETNTIVLNKPVSSFAQNSIQTNPLNEEENQDTSLNSAYHSLGTLKGIFNKANLDWLLRLGVLAILIIGAVKLLNPSKNVRIDLSAETKSRDINLLNSLNREVVSRGAGNMPSLKAGTTQKLAGSSIATYGLKEYQSSQVSPFKTSLGTLTSKNPTASGLSKPKPFTKVPSGPILSVPPNRGYTNPRPPIESRDMQKAKTNVDSLKFLETMAKIYERNGRADLAQNINLSIAQGRQNMRDSSLIR